MDFDKKLEGAIQRGQNRNSQLRNAERQKSMSAEEIRKQHTDFRLDLSEYIETNLKKMADHFPGFEYETIYGSRGWGGAIHRTDLDRGDDGKAGSFFSRLELTVKPLNEFNVVNIAGKSTIRDKELFSWNHFVDLADATTEDFHERLDSWMVQYAEQFAAR